MNCVSRPLFIPQDGNVQYIRATKPHELTLANFPPRSVVGYYKQKWKGLFLPDISIISTITQELLRDVPSPPEPRNSPREHPRCSQLPEPQVVLA